MIHTVYTIGYAGFAMDDFIATLRQRNISLVVDVRSAPFTQRYPDYNEKALANALGRNEIYYRNYAREFGARQEDKRYYPEGYFDFSLFSKSDAFKSGIEKLKRTMDRGYVFALMCSEIDPIRCHRAILVARAFYEDASKAYQVTHLLPGGKTQSQADLEDRLLEHHCRNWEQVSMFEPLPSRERALERAYRMQNREIGFTMEGDL